MQYERKLAAGEIFDKLRRNRTQIINEIMNVIRMQDERKLAAGEIFDKLRHNRTEIINEIRNKIDMQEQRKPAAGEIVLQPLSQSHRNY